MIAPQRHPVWWGEGEGRRGKALACHTWIREASWDSWGSTFVLQRFCKVTHRGVWLFFLSLWDSTLSLRRLDLNRVTEEVSFFKEIQSLAGSSIIQQITEIKANKASPQPCYCQNIFLDFPLWCFLLLLCAQVHLNTDWISGGSRASGGGGVFWVCGWK